MFNTMNDAQKEVIKKVQDASSGESNQKLFYLDGPGGSGKTYTYTTLWHLLRASGKKVATMAFTGIAAILLPEGKTCHKALGLTVPLYSDSNSTITPNSKQGKKFLETDVFIWDEALMALEIMDRLLRDLTKIDELFGGKILLLGGDFRQLLPVRKNGTRAECVNLSIKNNEVEFAEFLLKIGEGKVNDSNDNIEFPEGFEVETDLVEEVFGHLIAQERFEDVATSAILFARNADVDELNKQVVNLLPSEGEKKYSSVDNALDGEALQELLTQEYLNSLNPASLPPHDRRSL
uniref:ATP-dependent DNA helicase n=1 Tax=Panagrolaimus superbus TaxID=310955 RepID=A0A914YXD2_9BILA